MAVVASKFFGKKGKFKATPPTTPTSVSNPRPDLLSWRGNDVYETHPSDHAQVRVVNHSPTFSHGAARERTIAKRLSDDSEAVINGTADEWTCLVASVRQVQGRSPEHSAGSMYIPHCPAFEPGAVPPQDVVDPSNLLSGQCVVVSETVLCALKFDI